MRLLTVLFVLFALVTTTAYAQQTSPLSGSEWQLISLGGMPLVEGSSITLIFGVDSSLGGTGGCNHYGGAYSADDTTISVSGVFSTMIACEGTLAQEQVYFAALQAASAYTRTADALTISYGEGQELVFAPLNTLAGSVWELVTLNGADVIEGTRLTVLFGTTGIANGSGGCNTFRTNYQVTGEAIQINEVLSTRIACPAENENAQETAYFTALQAAQSYTLDGDTLTITLSDGAALVFSRVLTLAETSWTLVTLNGADVISGSAITLEFSAENQISGLGGCNNYSGGYQDDGEHLTFVRMLVTERACADSAITAQESAFLQTLSGTVTYARTDGQLTITTSDGQTLVFVESETTTSA